MNGTQSVRYTWLLTTLDFTWFISKFFLHFFFLLLLFKLYYGVGFCCHETEYYVCCFLFFVGEKYLNGPHLESIPNINLLWIDWNVLKVWTEYYSEGMLRFYKLFHFNKSMKRKRLWILQWPIAHIWIYNRGWENHQLGFLFFRKKKNSSLS